EVLTRHAELVQARRAAERCELLNPWNDRGEPLDGLRRPLCVPPECGRQADPVQRPVWEAVTAADRLCHRVREREARATERGAGVARAAEQLCPRLAVVRAVDDMRQRLRDQARAFERMAVRVGVVALDVRRLGAMS